MFRSVCSTVSHTSTPEKAPEKARFWPPPLDPPRGVLRGRDGGWVAETSRAWHCGPAPGRGVRPGAAAAAAAAAAGAPRIRTSGAGRGHLDRGDRATTRRSRCFGGPSLSGGGVAAAAVMLDPRHRGRGTQGECPRRGRPPSRRSDRARRPRGSVVPGRRPGTTISRRESAPSRS